MRLATMFDFWLWCSWLTIKKLTPKTNLFYRPSGSQITENLVAVVFRTKNKITWSCCQTFTEKYEIIRCLTVALPSHPPVLMEQWYRYFGDITFYNNNTLKFYSRALNWFFINLFNFWHFHSLIFLIFCEGLYFRIFLNQSI